MQINSKKKNASSPSFLDQFFCLLYLIGLIGGLKICFKSHKLLLLHFWDPAPGGGIRYNFFFFFFFFMSLSGRQIYIFLTLIFFIFMSLPGHHIFIFWPVENCTTWNLRYLMLRDAGWALRHWRSGLMFSCAIWALFLSILIQSWIKKNIVYQILGGGGTPVAPPSGSATGLHVFDKSEN